MVKVGMSKGEYNIVNTNNGQSLYAYGASGAQFIRQTAAAVFADITNGYKDRHNHKQKRRNAFWIPRGQKRVSRRRSEEQWRETLRNSQDFRSAIKYDGHTSNKK